MGLHAFGRGVVMGTEATWVPLVMAAISAGSQYIDQRQQQKRADRIALQGLQQTSERQRRADSVTQQLLQEMAASTPEAERQSTLRGFLDQLSRAQPEAQRGLQVRGGESETFRRDAADAALGVTAQGERYADLSSRLDAPALQRQRESATLFDRGMDIGLIGREQEGADRHNRLLLSQIRSNPWLQALSAVAGAYGSAYGGMGGGQKSALSSGTGIGSASAQAGSNPSLWLYDPSTLRTA